MDEKVSPKMPQVSFHFWILLFVFYLLISCLFTWPLITNLQEFVPGPVTTSKPRPNEDSFQFLWNIWWTSKAIDESRNPFQCPYLFHPQGAQLYFHTHTILQGVMAYPFVKILGLVEGTNIVLIMQLALGAFIAAMLGWEITKSRASAWIAGIGLGFCPFIFGRLQGHWCYSSIAPLVLVAWMLLRLKKDPTLKKAIGLSLAFVLLALADSTYLAFGFVLAACLIACYPRRLFPKLFISFALFFLIYSPVLIASYLEYRHGGSETVERGREKTFSADLAEYFTPNIGHPLLRNYRPFAKLVKRYKFAFEAKRLWPGLTILIFVSLLLFWRKVENSSEIKWFVLIAVLSFALSLGSPIQILRHDTVPFLYAVIDRIPILGYIRAPGRYGILVQLGLTSLAVIAAAEVEKRFGTKVLIAAGIFLLFEFLPAPIPIISTRVPEVVSVLKKQPYGCVWDVGTFDLEALLFQTSHQKPLVDGFYARKWSNDRIPEKLLRLLAKRASSGDPDAVDELKKTFNIWNVRYILAAKNNNLPHLINLHSQHILTVLYEDSEWTLYGVSTFKAAQNAIP
jgi:hypothetical protein